MNAFTITSDLTGFGTHTDIAMVITPILITLTVAFWTAFRLFSMLATIRNLSRDLADVEQRLVFFRAALDMLANELSDHLNTTHHKKGSLL